MASIGTGEDCFVELLRRHSSRLERVVSSPICAWSTDVIDTDRYPTKSPEARIMIARGTVCTIARTAAFGSKRSSIGYLDSAFVIILARESNPHGLL